MNVHSKAISPAQEAKITRKLAYVAGLEFPTFQQKALAQPFFCKWFKAQFVAIPSLEKITPEIRDAYLIALEAEDRAKFAADNERAEQQELDDAEEEAAEAERESAREREREHRRNFARDHGRESEDESEGEDPEPEGGGSSSSSAPAPVSIPTKPTTPAAPYVFRDGRVIGPGGVHYPSMQDYLKSKAQEDNRTPEQRNGTGYTLADNDPRTPILEAWAGRFDVFKYRNSWHRTHKEAMATGNADEFISIYLEPSEGVPLPAAARTAEWIEFESYTETVRRQIARHDNLFEGATLADPIDETAPDYVIEKMVPVGPAVTVVYGLPDDGKSMLAHKASIVVASDTLEFDGAPTLHGPVLYVSADSGARKSHVILRMRRICDRMKVSPEDRAKLIERLRIVDDAVNLLDSASVAKLLEKHPGPWTLIIIDPLVKCVGGLDLAQAGVMTPALLGAMRLGLETGAAVMVVTHEGRGDKGHPFGSIFGDADASAILHVVRHYKGHRQDGDRVTVTIDKMKNGTAAEPFTYHIDAAYLAAVGEAMGATRPAPGSIERADMLARLPTAWRPVKGSQSLVDDIMPARLGKAGRETLWRRLREAWQAAGLIEQKDGRIRRVA